MFLLPKIKNCPCCNKLNLIVANGIVYKNQFCSMADWMLKKIFNCRKCRVELGLFIHNTNKIEKIIWMEIFKCEDDRYTQLNNLHKMKEKNRNNQKKYNKTLDEINALYNKVRAEQTKIKIKIKIQNQKMHLGQVY
jgi:hypothetical protein